MASRPVFPFLVLFAAFALLAGCSRPAAPAAAPAAPSPLKLRFQTDWYPEPEHGGYYQALARGFYAEEGLEVEILSGGPNAQVMSGVATGRADLGMTNGDDVIVAISRGVPIRMIAAEMQRDPQGILFHEENRITDLRQLDGRTVMAGAGSTWIQVVQRKLGITFNIQPLVGDLARFMNDRAFLQQCFVTNEPFFARQRGARAGALLIASPDLGYEPYRVMFGSRNYLAAQPDVTTRFVRATLRGWIDYLTGDPEPGNRLLRALRPDLPADFYAYSIQAMKDYRLVLGDPARGEACGQLRPERLRRQIDLLREYQVLERPLSVDEVFAPGFLPPEAR